MMLPLFFVYTLIYANLFFIIFFHMSIHLVCFLLLLGLRKQSESESTCDAMQLVLLL